MLLTMYDARTRLSAAVADEVREHFGDRVLRTAIPRSVRVSEAPSYGQSVMTYDPASPGALSYREAAREMTHQGSAGMNDRPPQRRGLGRGLGSLIPTRSGPAERGGDPGRPRRSTRRRPASTGPGHAGGLDRPHPCADAPADGERPRAPATPTPVRRPAADGRPEAPRPDGTGGRGGADGPRRPAPASADLRPVAGAYFAELPVASITPEPPPAPPGLRRGGDGRAGRTRSRRSGCCSRSWCAPPATARYELIMGERRLARHPGGRARHDPGHRPGDRRRRRCCATRCWRTCTAPS